LQPIIAEIRAARTTSLRAIAVELDHPRNQASARADQEAHERLGYLLVPTAPEHRGLGEPGPDGEWLAVGTGRPLERDCVLTEPGRRTILLFNNLLG
jgi:hypothetical protein